MLVKNEFSLNFRVGVFIAAALALFLLFLFGLGGTHGIFKKRYVVEARFPNTAGLTKGATVRLSGVRIGTVADISFPKDTEVSHIPVRMEVSKDGMMRLTPDAMAIIKTEGLLGDKYIEILRGKEKPPEKLPDFLLINSHAYPEYDKLLGESEELIENITGISESLRDILGGVKEKENMENISMLITSLRKVMGEIETGRGPLHALIYGGENEDDITRDLKITIRNFRSISDKVNGGEGTLGALINDPELYDELTGVMGEAERSRFIRAAVRYLIDKQRERVEKKGGG